MEQTSHSSLKRPLRQRDALSARVGKGLPKNSRNGTGTHITEAKLNVRIPELVGQKHSHLILRWKTTTESPIKVGDSVQVFLKIETEKRGKRSSNRPGLTLDPVNRTVAVLGSRGRKITAAIEDVRPAISIAELAGAAQGVIYELDKDR